MKRCAEDGEVEFIRARMSQSRVLAHDRAFHFLDPTRLFQQNVNTFPASRTLRVRLDFLLGISLAMAANAARAGAAHEE